MKKKIAEALKTKYKSFGLSNEAWDRIASAKEETVTKEEDIEAGIADFATMDLIAKELQKMRDTEIQKRTDLQREHDDYKAKHPEENSNEQQQQQQQQQQPDMAKAIADAVAAAVKPLQDSFDAYKAQNSAKEAITLAKETFYANKWTTKFKDEADAAWERISELNEAKGNKMTQEELSSKAKEYFDAAVKRRGMDSTKPFDAEEQQQGNFDFSSQAKYLEGEGLLPEEKK